MNNRDLTEADIRTKFITPAIAAAGWDTATQMREEYFFTAGRIIVRGKLVARGKGKKADYLLYASGKTPIAVIEAKDNKHGVADGMQQALAYAKALDIPFVFSSNGDAFAFHDRTGTFPKTESELTMEEFPSPSLLQAKYDEWKGLTPAQEAITDTPYHDDGTGKEPRYYQRIAIAAGGSQVLRTVRWPCRVATSYRELASRISSRRDDLASGSYLHYFERITGILTSLPGHRPSR